ncbi:MAG: hypothetical protein V1837_02095 [Candidatus Woesearchaeota archaeon]
MKITIDTKEDSIEDIKKVIHLLSSVSKQEQTEKHKKIPEGQTEKYKNIFEEGTQASVFGNIFAEPENKTEKKERIEIIPY